MADSQQPVDQQVTDTQQVTSKAPATKQKIQNVSLRAKLSPRKRELLARHREGSYQGREHHYAGKTG